MPRILGTGLVALDLIVEHYESHKEIRASGGGTCGNVLAILATAGWQSRLLGALDDSVWSQILLSDLENAGVMTDDLLREPGAVPSLIVEHLNRSGDSAGRHWFSSACPKCQKDWPALRGAPDVAVRRGAASAVDQDVIFVDRLSDGVMELVMQAKACGSVIAYEPSSKADHPWMTDMLGLADIVKYSTDRESALCIELKRVNAPLLIRTDGARGTSWRWGGPDAHWVHRPADAITEIVDTCGAGDWFTAGLLHSLFDFHASSRRIWDASVIGLAIQRASALAAWSCGFVGARGALYDAPATELTRQVGIATHVQTVGSNTLRRPVLPDRECLALAAICAA